MFLSLFVCFSLSRRICLKFSRKVGNGSTNKWLNFGGDPDHRLDIGIVIRHMEDTESG